MINDILQVEIDGYIYNIDKKGNIYCNYKEKILWILSAVFLLSVSLKNKLIYYFRININIYHNYSYYGFKNIKKKYLQHRQ